MTAKKITWTLDTETIAKIALLAKHHSLEIAYFGGRKENKSAIVRRAIECLWQQSFGKQSLEDIMRMKYGNRPPNH